MKKIRCLLVDDEPLAIQLLQNHVAQLDFMEVAGTCPNAVKALEVLTHQKIDLLFLDIRMPQISGINFLKTLRNPPKTIITTAYREYALDGYNLDIVDYLLKPITFDRFFKAVERYLRASEMPIISAPQKEEPNFIFIKSGFKQIKIDLNDILYIESIKDYIKIQTIGKEIMAKYKITTIEEELKGRGFLRVHRSFIVSQIKITAFTTKDIEIGKIEIPIGESHKTYVLNILNSRH
jgi:two-component system, LytTR family, response regulator